MDAERYHAFTRALTERLAADERVRGLVAVGSMAASDHQPDEWSDHDFLMLVADEAATYFRSATDWLPDHASILLHFPETEHGVKILYQDGHLLEFAVFTAADFDLARINSQRVLVDRDGFTDRVARLVADTRASAAGETKSDAWLLGQFLTHLLVGLGRHARGEHLSGRRHVKEFGLADLLQLLSRHKAAEAEGHLDNLDVFRRFERAYPQLGMELNRALEQPTLRSALDMLDLLEAELSGLMDATHQAAAGVLRAKINELLS